MPRSATINRYGFNSLGADAVQDNLTLFAKKAREDPAAKPGAAVLVRLYAKEPAWW